jgi:hypothetical protein
MNKENSEIVDVIFRGYSAKYDIFQGFILTKIPNKNTLLYNTIKDKID